MKQCNDKLLWLAWKEGSNSKPFMSGATFPTTKFHLLDYVDKCFIKEGYQTWIKCQLAHDVTPEEFKYNSLTNWLKSKDIMSCYDRIAHPHQRPRICKKLFCNWVFLHSPSNIHANIERPARMPKFPHFYESLAFEFIAMHFYFCVYILTPVIPILNCIITSEYLLQ